MPKRWSGFTPENLSKRKQKLDISESFKGRNTCNTSPVIGVICACTYVDKKRTVAGVARGYRLIGEPKAGIPCISHDYKKVFATQTDLEKKLNYNKSDLGRLLCDRTIDEVLQKLGRVLK